MMTTAELRRRELVFETLAELGIPVVWNLAGGYQKTDDGSIPAVLEIHENTARGPRDQVARRSGCVTASPRPRTTRVSRSATRRCLGMAFALNLLKGVIATALSRTMLSIVSPRTTDPPHLLRRLRDGAACPARLKRQQPTTARCDSK